MLPPLPAGYDATRDALHRVAAHVVARRRYDVTGHFGLRASPGGFGTPAFGDLDEVVRVAGPVLVRERREPDGPHTSVLALDGANLAALAEFAGTSLAAPFSVGKDTPAVGDPDTGLAVASDLVEVLGDWLDLGARALDELFTALGPSAAPSVAQVWPEHFDLGCDVAVGATRANLGASVGDRFHAGPYVYVGPWTADRPGDPGYWNAPFGALLGYEDVARVADPRDVVVEFLRAGCARLTG